MMKVQWKALVLMTEKNNNGYTVVFKGWSYEMWTWLNVFYFITDFFYGYIQQLLVILIKCILRFYDTPFQYTVQISCIFWHGSGSGCQSTFV